MHTGALKTNRLTLFMKLYQLETILFLVFLITNVSICHSDIDTIRIGLVFNIYVTKIFIYLVILTSNCLVILKYFHQLVTIYQFCNK